MINPIAYSFNNFKAMTKPVNPNKMSIYYYNDTHGDTDRLAGILSSAKAFKEKMETSDSISFTLSAGDNCSGANEAKNSFFFNLMQNYMGVDISAIGNHECDAGAQGFSNAAKGKNINFVATNIKLSADNPMDEFVKKSIIKEQGGEKIGFIGTMPLDLKTVLKEDATKGIEVMDEKETLEAIQAEINNLKSKGVDKIILLSHVGFDVDKNLAQNTDGIDIIIGGHTHNLVKGVEQGENLVYSKSNEPVLITQAGENARYYGIVDVEFNDNGVLEKVNNAVIENPNTKKSPVIEEIKAQEVGKSPYVATLIENAPLPENRRITPCAWTELLVDAVKSELDVDIALVNSANIRKSPQPGALTERDIEESAPMKNNLLKTRITQKQLVDGIKAAAKQTFENFDGYPGLIQASGITYKVDTNGNILEMNFIEKDGSKTPIDINNPKEDITYSAAYDNFFSRADGETPEFALKFEAQEFDYDKDTAAINYISKLPNKDNLKVVDDGRLEVVQAPKAQQSDNISQKFLSLTSPKAA